jgi:hypothetical protein
MVFQKGGEFELASGMEEFIPPDVAKAYKEGKAVGCGQEWFVMPDKVEG